MVAHATERVLAAQPGTGILAVAVAAGAVRRTIRIDDTLGAAIRRRADHIRQAIAAALAVDGLRGKGVGTAGVGITGILSNHGLNNCNQRHMQVWDC